MTSRSRFEFVARVEDVPDGALLGVETMTGHKICLYNLGGRIGAVSNVCTHQDFPMADGTLLEDGTIECAWHGTRFDCATGAVRKPPALEPLPVYEVLVRDGEILVASPAHG
jgi:3-phenylpropionate/trans-cinnamate dioxygenase ferredoxin subunit